jgi:D-tagatose-1,6-bisphosphate aldolase subunit GatZ/KbaZ
VGTEWLRDVVRRNRNSEAVGVFSVCSAHESVLESAMRQALGSESRLLIESTSNQVNQFGGYTGMHPQDFREYVHSIARRVGLQADRVLLGGDHLGPYPWRKEKNAAAMEKACVLVRDCVLAGYGKIHLDASMACADDPERLSDAVVAERAARMCKAAEQASAETQNTELVYVIGTEVPVPGGEQLENAGPVVTKVDDMRQTLDVTHRAFIAHGLEAAWDRVIGLVVQPGVEFGDATVFDYERAKARDLASALPSNPDLVYEAHSTDYQTNAGLRALVENHFAILKVGPWLTFAYREALFTLSAIEKELIHGVTLSRVREALEDAMLRNPEHWQSYYGGSDEQKKFARMFSLSDRCRYYWPDPSVHREVDRLFHNLSHEIPLSLVSQYLPDQYDAVREGRIAPRATELMDGHVADVLRKYQQACEPT